MNIKISSFHYFWELNSFFPIVKNGNRIKKWGETITFHSLKVDPNNENISQYEVLNRFGIVKHNVRPYTPQENGKVERFWYAIERSRVRSLRGSYLESLIV